VVYDLELGFSSSSLRLFSSSALWLFGCLLPFGHAPLATQVARYKMAASISAAGCHIVQKFIILI